MCTHPLVADKSFAIILANSRILWIFGKYHGFQSHGSISIIPNHRCNNYIFGGSKLIFAVFEIGLLASFCPAKAYAAANRHLASFEISPNSRKRFIDAKSGFPANAKVYNLYACAKSELIISVTWSPISSCLFLIV